jgi:hypothetical protein
MAYEAGSLTQKIKKIMTKRQRKDILKLVRWCICFVQLRNWENARNSGKCGRALTKLYQNCLALTIEQLIKMERNMLFM